MSAEPGRTFGNVAEAYARTRPPYPRAAIERAAAELGLDGDSRVLDLGAGTGNLTKLLRELFADVVAVEPDGRMRERFVGEVLAGSAEEIPLPDGAVDAVFAGEAFHWFDHPRAMPEIRRVARAAVVLMRGWGETEQPGLLPAAVWSELERIWRRFHGERTRDDFHDWRYALDPDGDARYEETVRIPGRDLIDLHLTASTPASIPAAEREAIAARAYPLMDDEYELRVVTYVYWKRFS